MGRYNFVSPGAEAGNAIQKFLIERELMNQEMQKQALLEKQQAEQERRANEELALNKQREGRIADESKATREALEGERTFRRANTIATHGLPGVIDRQTADLLRGEGFGTLVNETGPGVIQFAGGSQYQNARQAEQARLAQAREAQAARAEQEEKDRQAAAARASEANETRAMIAGMANQGRQETTELRNDLLRTQVSAAEQKAAEKEEAKQKSRQAAKVTADQTVAVLKELADFDETTGRATLKDATKNLFGARNPLTMFGKETNDARAALNRVRGRVIVDLLNEMKNQSATGATGFGALSGPELELLQNAASELNNPFISNDRAAQELERIYKAAGQLYGTDSPGVGGNVRMKAPDGRTLSVPAADVERMRGLGAVEF